MAVARETSKGREMQTVVEVGPCKGLFGTMHSIIYEEGERGPVAEMGKVGKGVQSVKGGRIAQRRKGQGWEGLWRGWRVGLWGLVGVWGAATLGGVGSKGGEF